MKDLERQLKALANARRLAILKYLKDKREAAVSEIAGVIKLSIKATSKHLNILASVNIVESEQRSLRVFYRLSPDQKPAAKHIVSIL
jgi:DNA-binding transcriptional ArsR family regulator